MKFVVEIFGRKMAVVTLPTPEDVSKAVQAMMPMEDADALDGAYLWIESKDRHLVWFAEEALTRGVIVHEAAHIGLRNMVSPSANYEEDLANRIEEAYEILATALSLKGLLRS